MRRYNSPWKRGIGAYPFRKTKYKWRVGFATVKPTASWPGTVRQGLWRRSGKKKIWKF